MSLWLDKNFGPMLLEEISKPFNSKDYFFELKFDGFRSLIFVTPKSIKVLSRNKRDITKVFPELKSICQIVKEATIFDGEIVYMDKNGPNFSILQTRMHLKNKVKITEYAKNYPVVFVAFDILYQKKDLINLPLKKRKTLLDKFPENDAFIKSKYILNDGIKLFNFVKKANLEGIVAKKIDSPYEINTRSDSWLKIKNIKDGKFYIGGYLEKENSYVISLALGEYQNNKLHFVGKVSLGKKHSLYKKIKASKKVKISPFADFSENNFLYIKSPFECNVNFLERTKNNHLRHPVIK